MVRKGADLWRRDPRPGVLVVVAGVALALFLGLVFAVMVSPAFAAADEAASAAFRELQAPVLDSVCGLLTHVADFWVMAVLVVGTAFTLWALGRRSEVVLLAVVMSAGPAIGALVKNLVERARPGLEYTRIALPKGYSFPSGHALAAFLFFGTIAFIVLLDAKTFRVRLWVGIACGAAIALVSLSRVYLGVHWFGDITASWILGFFIMSLATAVYFVLTASEGASPS